MPNSATKLPAEPLITISEAPAFLRRRLGVIRSHWTLREDAKAGRLPCLRIGNRLYFKQAALRQFVEHGHHHGQH